MRRASAIKRVAGFCWRSIPISTQKTRATLEARGRKRHFYKPLLIEFRHNRFTYRQIAREGDAASYEQTWNGCQNPSIAYEVILIRRREGFEIRGRFVPPAEVYPRSEQWCELGWTFCNEDAAFAKLREICR
jgi:hypothetical protein